MTGSSINEPDNAFCWCERAKGRNYYFEKVRNLLHVVRTNFRLEWVGQGGDLSGYHNVRLSGRKCIVAQEVGLVMRAAALMAARQTASQSGAANGMCPLAHLIASTRCNQRN